MPAGCEAGVSRATGHADPAASHATCGVPRQAAGRVVVRPSRMGPRKPAPVGRRLPAKLPGPHKQDAWKGVCAGAQTLTSASERDLAAFFELNFDPHQVLNADDSASGMVTGYYEPLLRDSRARTERYRHPIYGVPSDLLVIDLTSVYPELKHRRLRGRIEGNRVVPYAARADIDRNGNAPKGNEIVWADDAIEGFFLHIQGSGQVEPESGERVRIGYAEQNGHPFRSLGRLLIERREIAPERASMKGIKDWARRNPRKVQEFLNASPSYVSSASCRAT